MNGSSCNISLFPSDQCAIVACANGNTDGDAADWATKIIAQALFDLKPEIDFVSLAEAEAVARREDYDRILSDWTRIQLGDSFEVGKIEELIPSEQRTKLQFDDRNVFHPETEYSSPPKPNFHPQPFAEAYTFPSSAEYIGTYRALNTTITITLPSSCCVVGPPILLAMFNDIPYSCQKLTWYKKDSWSWFPLTRDEWLSRAMIDWDFSGAGIFEFVRGRDTGTGPMSALLWQWDEHEKATRFERVI
jgi:hypothetical protein